MQTILSCATLFLHKYFLLGSLNSQLATTLGHLEGCKLVQPIHDGCLMNDHADGMTPPSPYLKYQVVIGAYGGHTQKDDGEHGTWARTSPMTTRTRTGEYLIKPLWDLCSLLSRFCEVGQWPC